MHPIIAFGKDRAGSTSWSTCSFLPRTAEDALLTEDRRALCNAPGFRFPLPSISSTQRLCCGTQEGMDEATKKAIEAASERA